MLKTIVTCNFSGPLKRKQAASFCDISKRLKPEVRLKKDGRMVNGKVEVAILSLGIKGGDKITIEIEAYETESDLKILAQFIEGGWNDELYAEIIKKMPFPTNQNYI